MKINVSQPPATERVPRLLERTTIAKIVGAGVTGTLFFVSAALTTVVESGGFWQYFWLGTCILFFVCAASLTILATREGMRDAGPGLEPPDAPSIGKQKTEVNEDHRVI